MNKELILLLSRQDDASTREVSEWLCSLEKRFIRINADDKKNSFLSCDVNTGCFTFRIHNKTITFSPRDIKSIWHRRSGFSKQSLLENVEKLRGIFHDPASFAADHLHEEATELFDFIYFLLDREAGIRKIGHAFFNSVNKLQVLKLAQECGLQIPTSYIITSKKEMQCLLKKEKKLLTKAIGNGVYRFTPEYGYYNYTEKITPSFIHTLPSYFFPSLVQKEITKEYELRIFCLEGAFYSMAIFSNEFAKTAIDNRKSFETPDLPRCVPYLLPRTVEKHLSLLMKKLELNTGSIDMIVTPEKQFYFLEINPAGQFGMVSKPCNYYLEKKIAEAL